MFKRLSLILTLFTALSLGIGSGVSAAPPTGPMHHGVGGISTLNIAKAQGVESAYSRSYKGTRKAAMKAKVIGITFKGESNAAGFLTSITKDTAMKPLKGYGSAAVEGDMAKKTSSTHVIAYQSGAHVFIVSASGDSAQATTLCTSLAGIMAKHKTSSHKVELKKDGSSTGGVFSVFPGSDDLSSLKGMTISKDMQLK